MVIQRAVGDHPGIGQVGDDVAGGIQALHVVAPGIGAHVDQELILGIAAARIDPPALQAEGQQRALVFPVDAQIVDKVTGVAIVFDQIVDGQKPVAVERRRIGNHLAVVDPQQPHRGDLREGIAQGLQLAGHVVLGFEQAGIATAAKVVGDGAGVAKAHFFADAKAVAEIVIDAHGKLIGFRDVAFGQIPRHDFTARAPGVDHPHIRAGQGVAAGVESGQFPGFIRVSGVGGQGIEVGRAVVDFLVGKGQAAIGKLFAEAGAQLAAAGGGVARVANGIALTEKPAHGAGPVAVADRPTVEEIGAQLAIIGHGKAHFALGGQGAAADVVDGGGRALGGEDAGRAAEHGFDTLVAQIVAQFELGEEG